MRKSIFSVVGVAAVAAVFCFGCNRDWNKVTQPETTEPETPISAKADTLCAYIRGNVSYGGGLNTFQSEAQLTSFLETTGYYKKDAWSDYYDPDERTNRIKGMTDEPDFEHRTYFAFGWAGWQHNISNILYDTDTVTVIYEYLVPNPVCEDVDGVQRCMTHDAAIPVVFVYSIPFTDKAIKVQPVMKNYDLPR